MDEKEYLSSLVLLAEDTVDFLSETRKWERECWICTEFLNALHMEVSPTDLVKSLLEPPDVIYKDAHFEIYIVLDKGRLLHADWKRELIRAKNAQSLDDLLEPYRPPERIDADHILEFIKPTILKKKQKYERRGISLKSLDILAYVNLKESSLDLNASFPDDPELQRQGWRSVSAFGNSYCRVLYADQSAPEFLRAHAGQTIIIAAQ